MLTSTLLVYQALDQFSNFSNHREELLVQQKEINQGAETIKNTIKVLDQRKDEAILRTFKGVSKHFMDVFKELVPRGTGCIQMHTESGEIEDAREEVRVSGRSVFLCIYSFYRMEHRTIFRRTMIWKKNSRRNSAVKYETVSHLSRACK